MLLSINMKNLIIAIAVLLVIGTGVFLYSKRNGDDEAMMGTPAPAGSSGQNTPAPSSAAATYKDGSYTGDTVQTDRGYGPIQVKAIIIGGKITDIQFLQMPSGLGHTSEVTAMAQPILKQEAIVAQNSQIDIVSGATQDTQAFQQSLASALTQAK